MQKSPKKEKREQEGLVANKVFATFLTLGVHMSEISAVATDAKSARAEMRPNLIVLL